MIELDKSVFDKFIIDQCDHAHMIYDDERDIVSKYVKNINELNTDIVKNRCNIEVLNMYGKIIGNFFLALKTLYRIEDTKRPEWLSMEICEEYAIKLRDAVHAKVGRNE